MNILQIWTYHKSIIIRRRLQLKHIFLLCATFRTTFLTNKFLHPLQRSPSFVVNFNNRRPSPHSCNSTINNWRISNGKFVPLFSLFEAIRARLPVVVTGVANILRLVAEYGVCLKFWVLVDGNRDIMLFPGVTVRFSRCCFLALNFSFFSWRGMLYFPLIMQ